MEPRRLVAPLAALGLLAGAVVVGRSLKEERPLPPAAKRVISPTRVSNQTHYPITVYGENFEENSRLLLSGNGSTLELPAQRIDDKHLAAVVPPVALAPEVSRANFSVVVVDPRGQRLAGEAVLEVVNDQEFPQPVGLMALPDGRALVADRFGDRLWMFPATPGPARSEAVGDGPRAMALDVDPRGRPWIVVVQEYSAELLLLRADLAPTETSTTVRRWIEIGRGGQAVAVDSRGRRAYVSNRIRDLVQEIDLDRGAVAREIPVPANPRALALVAERKILWGTSLSAEVLWRIDLGAPQPKAEEVWVGPNVPIVGGHTAPHSADVMGGKPARALVWSDRRRVLFAATIGPNIGPNAARMEVSMNGGISVIDAAGKFLRHVSLLRGVPEALALDDAAGLLFAADAATGRVVVLEVGRLADGDAAAAGAILGELELPPPPEYPLFRPAADFGVNGRSSAALHSGPSGLALIRGGAALLVWSRFTGVLQELDLSSASQGKLQITRSWPPLPMGNQPLRRRGEILYYTDLGNSRMTCDTCPPEGADGGILFTKTEPIQIYRSPNIRSAHRSAPFFTPAVLPSLAATAKVVLFRNRFKNPPPTREEIRALTEYTMDLTPPPNPFRGPGGALPRDLAMPDGRRGDARAGLILFEGKAGCASRCHPPPHFSADQDDATRGQLFDVGTPLMLPHRLERQDVREQGVPPPSLVGLWDNFPLLYSGAGGFEVHEDGTVRAGSAFAARRVLELRGRAPHGQVDTLSAKEIDDLLAYLLTL